MARTAFFLSTAVFTCIAGTNTLKLNENEVNPVFLGDPSPVFPVTLLVSGLPQEERDLVPGLDLFLPETESTTIVSSE